MGAAVDAGEALGIHERSGRWACSADPDSDPGPIRPGTAGRRRQPTRSSGSRPPRGPPVPDCADLALTHAAVALEAGEPEDALAHLGEVAAWQRTWPAPRGGWTLWEPPRSRPTWRWAARTGPCPWWTSPSTAPPRGARPDRSPMPYAAACTLPIEERLLLLEEALELTERGGCGLDGVTYRIDAAESHLTLDDESPAVGCCDRPSRSRARGATFLADRAAMLLAAQGVRPERADERTGLNALTPSERRIVDLAATSRTNRDIAETLFLTEKTVEFHLTNSYKKLGITSRHELARALAKRRVPRRPAAPVSRPIPRRCPRGVGLGGVQG